jgi:hypothetical protein
MVATMSRASDILANDSNKATDALLSFYQATPRPLLQMSIDRHQSGFAPRGRTNAEGWQNAIMLIAKLSGAAPSPNLDVQKGEGVWWTNEYLP